jgi:predicted nucleic acid-binding protein
MNAIADAGWIVALRSKSDASHEWAARIADSLTLPVLTCESVLAEVAFKLDNVSAVLKMLDDGILSVDFILSEHISRIAELAETYKDRKPDLADLCVIRMSEIFRQRTVLTTDSKDFKIYRRNRTEKIPFIAPG